MEHRNIGESRESRVLNYDVIHFRLFSTREL